MIIRVNTRYPADKVPLADPALTPDAYRDRMATPIMEAIDAMPSAYRALVNDIGYIEVYRAWRARKTPGDIAIAFGALICRRVRSTSNCCPARRRSSGRSFADRQPRF